MNDIKLLDFLSECMRFDSNWNVLKYGDFLISSILDRCDYGAS